MFRFIGAILERILIVICALCFAQIPLFIQQYEQQLIGRIAELRLQVEAIEAIAKGRTLQEYIFKFTSNSDPDFAQHGYLLQAMVTRYESLSHTFASLNSASPLAKPFIFVAHLYKDIAASTWEHFNLGLPLTIEGAIYSVAGVLVGMSISWILFSRKNRKRGEELRA